jgi:hypothetical protein
VCTSRALTKQKHIWKEGTFSTFYSDKNRTSECFLNVVLTKSQKKKSAVAKNWKIKVKNRNFQQSLEFYSKTITNEVFGSWRKKQNEISAL